MTILPNTASLLAASVDDFYSIVDQDIRRQHAPTPYTRLLFDPEIVDRTVSVLEQMIRSVDEQLEAGYAKLEGELARGRNKLKLSTLTESQRRNTELEVTRKQADWDTHRSKVQRFRSSAAEMLAEAISVRDGTPLQRRVTELEEAIRTHQTSCIIEEIEPGPIDMELWSVLS